MKKFLAAFVVGLSLLVTACDPSTLAVVQVFLDDLAAAQANFTAADMKVEAQCMADVQTKIKADLAAAAASKNDFQIKGLVSLGSAGYITAKQIRAKLIANLGSGSDAVSPSCQQLVGQMTITAGTFGLK